MKIIVIGYGRVGRQFVRRFDRQAHQVVVVDKERHVFEGPEGDTNVKMLVGNAIDEDLLREAGAEQADVLLALTRDENANLMIAQIARVIFNVPKVVAIIYDPQREASFHEVGIETLALTVAGADMLATFLEGSTTRLAAGTGAWQPSSAGLARAPVRPIEAEDASFYVIIVGGGLVGYYLARSLLKSGHEVTLIENDPEKFELVSHQIDCPVIAGDGSTTAILERAGASRANVLCAVTNHDQDNLIACQVAKFRFGVSRTVARVKNPKNEAVMRRLGVDTTVSSTAIIANVIEGELPTATVRLLADLRSPDVDLVECRLNSNSPLIGKPLRQISWPKECSLVGILRSGQVVTLRNDTTLESGDVLLAIIKHAQENILKELLFQK